MSAYTHSQSNTLSRSNILPKLTHYLNSILKLSITQDRLLLTKSVIDKYYDLRVFQEKNIVIAFMALHDANRGDRLTLDILKRRWVTFWLATALEAGNTRHIALSCHHILSPHAIS